MKEVDFTVDYFKKKIAEAKTPEARQRAQIQYNYLVEALKDKGYVQM